MSNFKFGTSTPSGTASPFSQNASGGAIFGNVGGSQTTSSASSPAFGAATSGAPSNLFGGQGTSSGGGQFSFGNAGQAKGDQQQSTTPSLFGSTAATPNKPAEQSTLGQQKPTLFGGGLGNNKPTTSSPLGSTTPAPATGGLFSNVSTTPAGPPPQSSAGQTFSMFSNAPQGASGSGSLFGNQPKPATTSAPSSSLGNAAQQQTQSAGGIFGGKTPTMNSGANFSNAGGEKQSQNQGTSGTDTPKTDAKPNLFGALGTTPTTTQSSGSLFTMPSGQASQPSQKPSPLSTTTSETTPKPAFGSLLTPASSTPSTTTTPAPAGGLFPSSATPKSTATSDSAATTSAPAAGNMFSNIGKQAATTSGAPRSLAAATTTAASEAPKLGLPAATSTAASTQAGATAAATAPSATKTTAGTCGSNLGASTAGPAPPAQSRLKNKTMDEIITRWATDLTKYQKEFQEQAEQVAEWDRMLVENGTKVQKLYGNTVDAERATQEVERQLASVEGQQDELSSWLDRYEQEVETLLSKQVGVGDTLQGPDQERERTYKLAERLSERLNDMGQDLTSMIDEVNSASSTLSKTTKADEPISQIVRILNSHLSQLQVIDQGTATLRAKIAASQKVGNSLSGYRNGTPGSAGGGAAEDFYRAYMGRR